MYTHVYVDIYTHAPYPCCSLPASPYTLLELLFGLRSHVVSFVRPGLGVCLFTKDRKSLFVQTRQNLGGTEEV